MKSVPVKYQSELHGRLKEAILQRKQLSDKKMSNFTQQWDDADDSMRAYIHEKDLDKKRKDKKKFDGEVDYVTLEVPYTYAIVMTAHTYFTSVFLSRAPIWQFTARHGEAQDSVQAVEAVMDYQLKVGAHLPVMFNWIYDMARYSLGIIGTYWEEEEKVICTYEEVQNSVMGIPLIGKKTVKKEEIIPGFAGNKIYNIRPYDFFPDPRVPVWRFQDGEFCIRLTSESYTNILNSEHVEPGSYINLQELVAYAKEKGDSNSQYNPGTPRAERPLQPGEATNVPGPGFYRITEAYIKLIPSQWGLGDGKRIELWVFTLAEGEVIISAKPLGLYHNRYPFAVMEQNFGSEEFAKFGMLETIRPLTDILTWLINSHFYNVRRVLNNQIIFDPSRVTMKDLTKPGQRLIRLKPNAYGTDPRMAIHQLVHTDVTSRHLGDAQYIEQMIQRVSAVVDNIMGVPNTGGRKTATEVRQNTGFSTNRLKTPVEYNSALALDPLSQMMLSNTQQLLSIERKYMIAGNTLDHANSFLEVNAEKIAGSYDFVPVDGTMPIDRLAQANFWKELLMQMSRVPELTMQWDIGAMLAHTMKMQGERNIDRFRIKMNVMQPGADPAAMAQAGNVVPLGGASGRGRAAGGTGTSGGTL